MGKRDTREDDIYVHVHSQRENHEVSPAAVPANDHKVIQLEEGRGGTA